MMSIEKMAKTGSATALIGSVMSSAINAVRVVEFMFANVVRPKQSS